MTRLRLFSILCLSGFHFACGDRTESPPNEDALARIAGTAVGLRPLAGERVRLLRLDPGGGETTLVEGQTGPEGEIELEAPMTDALLRLDVGFSAAAPTVSVLFDGLSLEGERSVNANVFTRLASTRALREIRRRDRSPAVALSESHRLIADHFGGVDHQRVQPASSFGANPEDAAELSALLVSGLEELATSAGVSLATLLDAFNTDLATDGVFDGQGPGGPMTMGGMVLSGDSLRGAYADALMRVLERSGLAAASRTALLDSIRYNQSELFPRSILIVPERADAGAAEGGVTSPEDLTGPTLELALLDASDAPLPAGTPVRAIVAILAIASDPSGIESRQLSVIAADGQSRTLDTEELDTTALTEGEFELRFEAVDTFGNLSRESVRYLADNRAPTIALTHPAVVGTSPATVTVTAADEDAVERVTLMANGTLAAALRTPAEISSVSVAIDCPGTTTLQAAAYDRAGNLSVSESSIVCEDRGPSVLLHPASWRQEGNVTATYRPDGRAIDYATNQPIYASFEDARVDELVIERYWPRLHESMVGRADLPRLRFEIGDRAGGGVTVSVRHETAAGPGAWFQPEVVGDLLFEVPISYEALGAGLLTGHASSQAIVVRAVDVFGVTTERAVRFRLALRSPPLWVGSCSIMASTLDPATTVNQIRTAGLTPMGSFATRYAVELPSGSPITPPSVSLTPSSSGAFVELMGSGLVRFDGSFANRVAASGPSYLSCGWVPAGVGSPYENFRCQGIDLAGTWTWLQTPSTGAARTGSLPAAEALQIPASPINQVTASPVEFSMYQGGTPVSPSSGSSFSVAPDVDFEAQVSMRPTPIRIQNQIWNWPSQASLAVPGLVPAVSFGSAYWLPSTSGELGVHGRNLSCTPSQRIGGVGGTNVNPSCTWQERAVQTLPRLRRLVLRTPQPSLSANLSGLGLSVPVQVAPDCAAGWRYELDLGLL